MDSISEKIIKEIENKGLKAKLINISSIKKIDSELAKVQTNNPFVKKYLSSYFDEFNYDVNSVMKTAKSILIIAVPDPITRINFNINNKKKSILMPPMYLYNSSVKNEKSQNKIIKINKVLEKILSKYFFEANKINLPAKLLAVKSGLGVYGKNNICYINGIGSFMWLGIYLTDIPCEDNTWVDYNNMKMCDDCDLCINNCPTNALDTDRFVVKANKCITYHNESENIFPKWIEKNNSIIGCLRCQIVCPMNKSNVKNIKNIASFDEKESKQILNEIPLKDLNQTMIKKLESINFIEYYNLLARNLKLLIKN